MSAQILDGAALAAVIKEEVRLETITLRERRDVRPGLAFLLVGDNPASRSYVRSKGRACDTCGFHSTTVEMSAETTQLSVLEQIDAWNLDPDIHGILVQLPLPAHIDEDKVINAISPRKDVDGFHPVNVGRLVIGQTALRPCTPAGIQELLVRNGIETDGRRVVIVGRSNIVGKPLANMLMQKGPGANAIVTVAHSGAEDLAAVTREADILIVAIGRPAFITGHMVKEGAVVIDVGINQVDDPDSAKGYRIVGDVHAESVSAVASALTPVPGGVGPMTIAMLMKNTLLAAQRSVAG
ncbi:MAG: bifunctional methylenetetrahydrofolate dehydrogenase/methenyltetrahydrofolate cyclohydrolase FolD [Ignavibacteriae bacterium]|jgi:methylenetetrahydrofolate dehydrogenase (NADP+)/methenyltetrahydrofolate cyclohydrolase|nr:bifunctional methylenetetrahydrofolate dehydrogenase/methenyltetrahydrofolate cyclohydrolase FolD [Ignavibacteriota bacterium]